MKFLEKPWYKIKLWLRQHPILSAYIAGILTWIIVQALGGIVGNSAYDYWIREWLPWLKKQATINNLTFIGVSTMALITGFVLSRLYSIRSPINNNNLSISDLSTYLKWARNQELIAYQKIMDKINQNFQASLFSGCTETELNDLIDKYFLTIFHYLNPEIVNGGGILLIDAQNPDWLYFWRMGPDQSESPKRFFIGPEGNVKGNKFPRGVAGFVFLQDKTQIVKILNRLNGDADNKMFHNFDMAKLGHPRYVIPYNSFICLPVHFNFRVVGVLSLESQNSDTFDEESVKLLQPIADLLGTILYSHGKLSLP
jgi:hypothetical protein